MFSDTVNVALIILWVAIALFIVYRSWQARQTRIGTTVTYVVFFALSHWVPMVIITFSWFEPRYTEELNWLGFYQSLIAIICFMIGALVIAGFVKDVHRKQVQKQYDRKVTAISAKPPANLPIIYTLLGLVFIFVISPILSQVPTVGAFVSGMESLFQAGLFLLLWQGYQRRSRTQILIAWSGVIIWPVITAVIYGFTAFAASFFIFFTVFSLHLTKKPIRHIALLGILGYVALSFLMGYWSFRSELRGTIWYGGEDSTLDVRAELAVDLIQSFRFFDLSNPEHLAAIDQRLNYNHFTGLTVTRVQNSVVSYAYGSTITDAIAMVIPRALWPEKPVRLGGDEVVERYAGVALLAGSRSPGNLMEFYLNFGTLGVIVGFMFLGTVIGVLDNLGGVFLVKGDLFNFVLILVSTFTLVSVTGSFISMVGGTISGFLTILGFNFIIRSIYSSDKQHRDPYLYSQTILSTQFMEAEQQ